MKCYCKESQEDFIFCVENSEERYYKNIEDAWFQKDGNLYIKNYPSTINDKEILKVNFPKLGESMFKGNGDWKKALLIFASKCEESNIDWYITGSVSEAVMGVNIKPHDIDIVTHVNDFYRVKKIFKEYMIEPFVDNNGAWIVRYFGRLCIEGVQLDIVADDSRNKENYGYQNVGWNNYRLYIEPLETRYNIELERGRIDRSSLIKDFMNNL